MTTTTELTYVCNEPFASGNDVCRRNEIVRASDPRYIAVPGNFSPVGTPDRERPPVGAAAFDLIAKREAEAVAAREAAYQAAAAANVIKLEARPQKILRAASNIVTFVDGAPATIMKGSTVTEGDPLVHEHPDAFVPARR